MLIEKLTSDGKITIPEEIRTKLGLEEGDELLFFVEGPKVILLHILKPRRLTEFAGILPATRPDPGKEAMRQEVGEVLAKEMLSEAIRSGLVNRQPARQSFPHFPQTHRHICGRLVVWEKVRKKRAGADRRNRSRVGDAKRVTGTQKPAAGTSKFSQFPLDTPAHLC
ncbi:MAG: AbrB/MazE/SpoVT family DNA-binding domain-containing protein [Oscillatoria princeps RMCB-10]|jgi:AbrB family looped-hinge helix DNA binding protein|nr:AbrB/MazE/SpoVT family DNA-binding domain-containing protein [Oscillatoria princeps RMCB-10]